MICTELVQALQDTDKFHFLQIWMFPPKRVWTIAPRVFPNAEAKKVGNLMDIADEGNLGALICCIIGS